MTKRSPAIGGRSAELRGVPNPTDNMEDSPMFRAKLDGFASRAKQMTQELSAVIKTTDKYHHTGEKFAKLTASLAKDFRAYGSRRSAAASRTSRSS